MSAGPRVIRSRADLTDREAALVELAMHEAGHAVVGAVLGGTLAWSAVRGSPDDALPLHGNTLFADMPAGVDAQVAYAGPFAAAYWLAGNRRPTQTEVMAQLRAGGCGDDQTVLASGPAALTAARVAPLVERCWPAIRAVAGTLVGRGSVVAADVSAALRLSADPQVRGVQLANIRSGAAPGSFRVTPTAV